MESLSKITLKLSNGLLVLTLLTIFIVFISFIGYELYVNFGWWALLLIPIIVLSYFIGAKLKLIEHLNDENVKIL